jgi:hypothetical protein
VHDQRRAVEENRRIVMVSFLCFFFPYFFLSPANTDLFFSFFLSFFFSVFFLTLSLLLYLSFSLCLYYFTLARSFLFAPGISAVLAFTAQTTQTELGQYRFHKQRYCQTKALSLMKEKNTQWIALCSGC